MRRPGVNFDMLGTPSDVNFIQINPATGNRQLIPVANDVMFIVELLGNVEKAAVTLGVEEIEIHHWADDHYVPTRYAERIRKLTGWSIWSLQEPPIGVEWLESDQLLH